MCLVVSFHRDLNVQGKNYTERQTCPPMTGNMAFALPAGREHILERHRYKCFWDGQVIFGGGISGII